MTRVFVTSQLGSELDRLSIEHSVSPSAEGGMNESSSVFSLLLCAQELRPVVIEELIRKKESKEAFALARLESYLMPVASTGFCFYVNKQPQWLANESVLQLPSGEKVFIARLQGGSTLNRLEGERHQVQAAILWNDLPFGLTQCALEIDVLGLSKRLGLPVFWVSTQWDGKSEVENHRRGYWVSNANGEIVRSEFQANFPPESFALPVLQEISYLRRTTRELDPNQMGLKILKRSAE
jgi:hypothetical protein